MTPDGSTLIVGLLLFLLVVLLVVRFLAMTVDVSRIRKDVNAIRLLAEAEQPSSDKPLM